MIFSMERQALTVSSPNPINPRRCVCICAIRDPVVPVTAIVAKTADRHQLVIYVSIISSGTPSRAKGSRQAETFKG